MDVEQLKKKIGERAAGWIENGMLVGLGTGSTVFYFIEELTYRCQRGLSIKIVSSSNRSFEQAKKGGIPLANMDEITHIDVTVDGADEIDGQKRMIKGRGGALLREKILAAISQRMLVIVDDSKLVKKLGKQPLPVEILPFGYLATVHEIQLRGYRGKIRTLEDGQPYQTDNGNYIYDISFQNLREDPKGDHERLICIPGVLETGLFFDLPVSVLVGESNGRIQQLD